MRATFATVPPMPTFKLRYTERFSSFLAGYIMTDDRCGLTGIKTQEVDLGLAADVGTLQRLPKIIANESLGRELCFTARMFYADEAKGLGFVR